MRINNTKKLSRYQNQSYALRYKSFFEKDFDGGHQDLIFDF